MSLLAVAPGKFSPGLEADGFAYRKDQKTKAKQRLDSVPFDYTVTALDRLDELQSTDAHFVAYVVRRNGAPLRFQPRINKTGLDYFESTPGYRVGLECLVADIDNPGHAPWSSPAAARAEVARVYALLRTCAAYATSRGLRVLQPLARAIPIDSAEACLRVWLAELERAQLAPDWECADWTRHFRAPNVKRDRADYRSPAIFLQAKDIPAPVGASIVRQRGPRRAPRSGAVSVALQLSPA